MKELDTDDQESYSMMEVVTRADCKKNTREMLLDWCAPQGVTHRYVLLRGRRARCRPTGTRCEPHSSSLGSGHPCARTSLPPLFAHLTPVHPLAVRSSLHGLLFECYREKMKTFGWVLHIVTFCLHLTYSILLTYITGAGRA